MEEVSFSKFIYNSKVKFERNKVLIYLMLLFVWFSPSLFLSYIKYADPFLWWPLSGVATALNSGELSIAGDVQPAYSIILYSISGVTGLSAVQLSYFPIGGVVVPICYYALSKKILKSNIISVLLATYVAYDFSIYPGHYNVFAYTWARPLFLSFLLLYISYLSKKVVTWKFAFPIILVFLATYHLHPTYTSWMILFSIFINIFSFFAKRLSIGNVTFKLTIGMALTFIIVFFSLNQYFYNIFLSRVILTEFDMILDEFTATIRVFLNISEPSVEKYALSTKPPTQVIGWANFMRTLLILITLVIASFLWLKNNFNNLREKVDDDIILVGTFFLVGVGHTVGYALYGHMSLRFITLMYPIIVTLMLKNINIKNFVLAIFLVSLISLSFLQTSSFIVENYNTHSSILDYSKPSCVWFLNKTQDSPSVLSDFHTSQIFNFYFASENRYLIQQFYDSEKYEALITTNYNLTKALLGSTDYIVVNRNMDSTPSVGWKTFEPLFPYSAKINTNLHLNKVYDDSNIWIFKTR